MAAENGAEPNTVVVEIPSGKSTASDPLALAKTVQGAVVSKAKGRRWKWSKKKKEAFSLLMKGLAITDVASKIGAHRNTLSLWMKAPEWVAEAQKYVGEKQLSTKLRRLTMTTAIADQLAAKSVKALEEEDIDPSTAGLMLRSHLEYVRAERDLFGDGEGQAQGGTGPALHIHVGAPGQPQPVGGPVQATAVLAFRDFMAKYDPNLAVVARSPQEAAALLAEKVLQESNLLDTIREEDRETTRLEQEAAEAIKRRR